VNESRGDVERRCTQSLPASGGATVNVKFVTADGR
jgi:hypothetical protein